MAGPVNPNVPVSNVKPVLTETKPGVYTTEFWVSVALIVLGALQQAVGLFNISDARVATLQTIIAAAYAIARGLSKAGVPNTTP